MSRRPLPGGATSRPHHPRRAALLRGGLMLGLAWALAACRTAPGPVADQTESWQAGTLPAAGWSPGMPTGATGPVRLRGEVSVNHRVAGVVTEVHSQGGNRAFDLWLNGQWIATFPPGGGVAMVPVGLLREGPAVVAVSFVPGADPLVPPHLVLLHPETGPLDLLSGARWRSP